MKTWLREVKYSAQSHTAKKQQRLNLNLGLMDSKTCVLIATHASLFIRWADRVLIGKSFRLKTTSLYTVLNYSCSMGWGAYLHLLF